MMTEKSLTRESIQAVNAIIDGHIRRTPVVEVAGEDFGLRGLTLVFKLEFLQHAGSFKARGAFTHMLTRDVPAVGVVAASGGNHGAATAFAAARSGHQATIFVPSVASPAKVQQIRDYGAELRIAGDHVRRSGQRLPLARRMLKQLRADELSAQAAVVMETAP